jgi:RNA polymerase sigma-70 factor (ECF subfamily)
MRAPETAAPSAVSGTRMRASIPGERILMKMIDRVMCARAGDSAETDCLNASEAASSHAGSTPAAVKIRAACVGSGESVAGRKMRSSSTMAGDAREETGSPRITGLLLAWRAGDEGALDELVPLVHAELRRIARRQMGRERPGHTLQPTALVNEAYLRLVDIRQLHWQNRAHFFAMAARLMRRVLVDYARSRRYQKRGGGAHKVSLAEGMLVTEPRGPDVIALDDALEALAATDARKARVVELRFFGGLTVEETAEVLAVSVDTVMRDWKLAKVWLLREMGGS